MHSTHSHWRSASAQRSLQFAYAIEDAPHSNGSGTPQIHYPALPPRYSALVVDTTNMGTVAARRRHNSLQPFSRLNQDILELLLLTAAHQALAPYGSSTFPPTPAHTTLIRTVLTYAQLTSSLRQTALRSARLWALLVDFEQSSFEWNAELLRRSAGVGLQVVWQWSKAIPDGPDMAVWTRNRSGSVRRGYGLQDGVWDNEDRSTIRDRRRAEDARKRARLDKVLQNEVLGRATDLGFAVPEPYFYDVLLDKLGSAKASLPKLESLRIVKSRHRRPSVPGLDEVEQEGEGNSVSGKSTYVPLGVIANAPRLKRFAMAECNLSFQDLLPPFSPAISKLSAYPSPSSVLLDAVHTLCQLQSLHIADLPLQTAPTVHEWLSYLTLMPALEELVLEGAVLRNTDLILRDTVKEDSGTGRVAGAEGPEVVTRLDRENRTEYGVDKSEDGIDKDALPTLRVLTIDAALEDVIALTSHLPLPCHTPSAQGVRWSLLCADVEGGDPVDFSKLANVFSDVVGVVSRSTPPLPSATARGLILNIRATDRDIFVHLSTIQQPIFEGTEPTSSSATSKVDFFFQIHWPTYSVRHESPSSDVIEIDDTARSMVSDSHVSFIPSALGVLGNSVIPRVVHLDLDLPVSSSTLDAIQSHVLPVARVVERLTLGNKVAKGVLRTLCTKHNYSPHVDNVEASYSSTTRDSDFTTTSDNSDVLLPSLNALFLHADSVRGPTWTALLRFLKARKGDAVPILRIAFKKDVENRSRDSLDPVDDDVPLPRIRELERLGVEVNVNGS